MLLTACAAAPTLQQAHTAALRHHVYVTDQAQYGIPNKWVSSLRGDCEDYALYMRERVGGVMLYVRAYTGEAHIVLLVNGVFDKNGKPIEGQVVDNMSKVVYPLSQMKHKYVYTIKESEIERWLKRAEQNN
jgi:predicted transglutaminase-like cysteine proteinase